MAISTGILFAILSMLGWGTADFFAAKVSRKIGNLRALFWSQLIGVVLVFIYFFTSVKNLAVSLADLAILGSIGLFQASAYLAYYQGLAIGKVSLVSPISASWSLITVLISLIFLKENLTQLQLFGVGLTILGVFFTSTNLKKLRKKVKLDFDPGVKFAFIAMLSWGIGMALIDPQVDRLGWFLPIMIMRIFLIIYLLLYSLGSKTKLSFVYEKNLLLNLFPVGLLETIGFFGYSLGVRAELGSIVAPVAAASPLVTILLARLFLQEKVVFNQMIGIIGIILGIVFLSL